MTAHDVLTAFNALPQDQQQLVAAEILRCAPITDDLSEATRTQLAAELMARYDSEELADEDVKFPEETITVLSDRDRDRFLELINNPPAPNAALRKAMSKHRNPDA